MATAEKALIEHDETEICLSLRDFGTQRAVTLCIPKRSCKVVETLPCEV